MEINIKKSGLWAFEGIWVEELKEGPQEMEDKKALELIDAGRATAKPFEKPGGKAWKPKKEKDSVIKSNKIRDDLEKFMSQNEKKKSKKRNK